MRAELCLSNRHTGEVWFEGVRASQRLKCPVCHRPDWCLVDPQRGSCICPRTISNRRIGEAGYYHEGRGEMVEAAVFKAAPKIRQDFAAMMARYREAATTDVIEDVARDLGLTTNCLFLLETGYCQLYNAVAWPMRNEHGKVIGIRLRKRDGSKFAIGGSQNGLFWPPLTGDGPVFLPEGPTDTAAILSTGLDAIGRPFSRGGVRELESIFRQTKRDAVVVADRDEPGMDGARVLADALSKIVTTCIIKPPPRFKDSRDWVKGGATKESFLWMARNQRA